MSTKRDHDLADAAREGSRAVRVWRLPSVQQEIAGVVGNLRELRQREGAAPLLDPVIAELVRIDGTLEQHRATMECVERAIAETRAELARLERDRLALVRELEGAGGALVVLGEVRP